MTKKEIREHWYKRLVNSDRYDAWKEFMLPNCEKIMESKENCESWLKHYASRIDLHMKVFGSFQECYEHDTDIVEMFLFCEFVKENYNWRIENNG